MDPNAATNVPTPPDVVASICGIHASPNTTHIVTITAPNPIALHVSFTKPFPDISKIEVFDENFKWWQEHIFLVFHMYGVTFTHTEKLPFDSLNKHIELWVHANKDAKVQINEYHKLLKDLKSKNITLSEEFHKKLFLAYLITHIIIKETNKKEARAAKIKEIITLANLINSKLKRSTVKKITISLKQKTLLLRIKKNLLCLWQIRLLCTSMQAPKRDNPTRPNVNVVEADDIIAATISQANIVINVKEWVINSSGIRHICGNRNAFASHS
ncbi:hypothetical protein CXB51_026373 [Gossypium anomalum]|uniref:Uncharacterized protein n=1 Tax=Gossypium anomalum TaxID=47600 RepID=A0A8J6CNH7_9ROSI|nr:hypothetical protein CXB51_026373 [Gossypium anomalum]